MAKLGFLGLGIMGYPMARNLRRAGHDLAVWSHTKSKPEKLAKEEGATVCATPKDVAAQAECIFICVGDSKMSEQVILGNDGIGSDSIIAGAKPGTVVVDASTVSPSDSVRVTEALAAKGIEFLGAPCTGSKPGAENGKLTFMIGGKKEVFDRVKPYFEPMGQLLYYCGGPAAGLNAKLTQNLILSNLLQAFNEGMVLSTKAGIDPKLMVEILDNSAAKSGLISFKAPYVFRRDFATNFSVKWMHKDISLMLESALEQGVPLPLTATTQQMFRMAMAQGLGEEDICSTIKVLEKMTGTEVKAG